ncbi:hypothetical protein Tco_0321008 [Tanacetum coccineum]
MLLAKGTNGKRLQVGSKFNLGKSGKKYSSSVRGEAKFVGYRSFLYLFYYFCPYFEILEFPLLPKGELSWCPLLHLAYIPHNLLTLVGEYQMPDSLCIHQLKLEIITESNDYLQLNVDGNDIIQQATEFHKSKYKLQRSIQFGTFTYQIIREDHTDVVYVNFPGLLNDLTRDDLKELYRLMMLKYGDSRPKEEYERVLWGDLKTMFDPPSIEDAVWSLTHQQKVLSWRYFHSCAVHCLTLEAAHIYMLTEVKYPLPSRVCQAMLEKRLIGDRKDEEAHNEDTQRNLKFTSEDQVRGGLLGIIVNKLKSGSYRVKSGRHKTLAFEVRLTSHMLKVAKLSQEPKLSLILSSEKVNADDTADKSSSRTSVQPVTQPKAPTDLKPKKKKIPPSSKPKSSYKVRVILPKTQVAKTQHAEETVATADATKSLDTSESVEEQVNQPKTVKAEKIMDEIDQRNKAAKKHESSFDTKFEIKIIKRFQPSQPDDDVQITFLGFKTPDSVDDDFKEGTGETFYASADMPAQSDPLGHLHEELRIPNNKIDQLESNMSKKVTDDIQSSVPSIVADSLKENLPSLLLKDLKNTLPQLIKDFIKQSVSKSIKEKLLVCLSTIKQETEKSHQNPKLGGRQSKTRFRIKGIKDLRSMYKDMVFLLEAAEVFKKANAEGEKWEKNNPDQTQGSNFFKRDSSEKNVSDDEPPVKKLKFLIPTSSSILSPTPLKSILPEPTQKPEVTKMTLEQFTEHLTKTLSSIFSPAPPREPTPPRDPTPLKDETKGKGIATEEPLKEIMPYMEEGGSVPKIHSLKSFIILEGKLTNEDVMAQVKDVVNSSNEATMRITRGNDPLNVTIHDKSRLKTLGFSKWLECVLSQAKALGIPPPHEVSTFGDSINDRKRKRSSEILQEVFVKENVVVDGMHRNIIPPPGVEGRKGLVIREPESGIFYYNGNFNLAFQREEEFHLATTAQLIRLHDAIQRGTLEAEEMFKKIGLTIEARDDVD